MRTIISNKGEHRGFNNTIIMNYTSQFPISAFNSCTIYCVCVLLKIVDFISKTKRNVVNLNIYFKSTTGHAHLIMRTFYKEFCYGVYSCKHTTYISRKTLECNALEYEFEFSIT